MAYLKVIQQDVIRDAVQLHPLASGSTLRHNLKHLSPQQQVSPELKKSIQRLVIKEKVSVMAQELDGVKTTTIPTIHINGIGALELKG